MSGVLSRLGEIGVIPVVAIEKEVDAKVLADTLVEGGLPCAEITFRTAAAGRAIGNISGRGDILVGAGTVLTVDQVRIALDAGARFMVCPGFNPKVVGYCLENNVPVTPGVCTPSDIEAAMDFGLDVLKYFPAEAFGGLATLKAVSAPYPSIRFIPTGGINLGNLSGYLEFPKVIACGGTWIASQADISTGRFDGILENTRKAAAVVARSRRHGL
jgi:2-dehydro-3-deoxyphosphogluconate aldolase/(4S)-4-hydroxy-2-oxoglutarate aldolase